VNNGRFLTSEDRFKSAELNIQMANWVADLAHWHVIATLTFEWEASVWSAQRCYEKFMRTEMRGISHFYALEQNPSRDGFHCHALWTDCKNMRRDTVWQKWFRRYGRGEIKPVNNQTDVTDYVSKYVTKAGAWWDVKLLNERHPNNANFKLT